MAFGSALAALAPPARARADEGCGKPDRPWVEVTALDPSVAALRGIVPLMRAGLAARQIDVCPEGTPHPTPPIATVDVSSKGDGATIAVQIRDQLTAKRVVRDVNLAAVPSDGRSLTLATAAEELLRATWAELGLTKAPAPAAPVPPAVRVIVEEDHAPPPPTLPVPPVREPIVAFATMAAADVGEGGLLYGADVRVTLPAASRLAGTLRIGLRQAPVASAPDGQVHTTVLLGGLGGSGRLTPAERSYALDVLARVDLERVTYVPVAAPSASGHEDSNVAVVAAVGLDGWVAIAPSVRVIAELLADFALRAVRANDANQQVTAIAGAGAAMGVGLVVAF
jgi:hypothetical protein